MFYPFGEIPEKPKGGGIHPPPPLLVRPRVKVLFLWERKIWQRTCLLEPKHCRYRCVACHPSQFFPKNNLSIQKAVINKLLFTVPCSQQGNQVHIYNFYQYSWYSFGKQWWNKRSCCVNKQELMKFKCNQMMHSYKFYSFLRDQSLETGWNI